MVFLYPRTKIILSPFDAAAETLHRTAALSSQANCCLTPIPFKVAETSFKSVERGPKSEIFGIAVVQ